VTYDVPTQAVCSGVAHNLYAPIGPLCPLFCTQATACCCCWDCSQALGAEQELLSEIQQQLKVLQPTWQPHQPAHPPQQQQQQGQAGGQLLSNLQQSSLKRHWESLVTTPPGEGQAADGQLPGGVLAAVQLLGRCCQLLQQPVRLEVPRYAAAASSAQGGVNEELQKDVLQEAQLVMRTASMAGSSTMRTAGPFDVAVLDEAAQLVEAESCIVVARWPQLKVLVLVGDHKQLPATVISQEAAAGGYGRSMFERLEAGGVR
jgi:hypothetical protein